MNRLRLNDIEVDFSLEATDTISTVVAQIAKWSEGIREYPVKLIVDGTEYSLTETEWHGISPHSVDTVDIYTFSPQTLREYLPQLDNVSQLLQGGKKKEAMEIVFKVSLLLSYILAAIPFLELAQRDEIETQMKSLTGDLHTLQQSIAQDDTILTGDLMEYEIRGKLEQLLNTLAV